MKRPRSRPSSREIAAALRYYEGLRIDGEPPPENETAVGPDQTETAEDAAREKNHTARIDAREEFRKAKRAYDLAIKSVIAGDPLAAGQVDDALAALNAARAESARIGEVEQC